MDQSGDGVSDQQRRRTFARQEQEVIKETRQRFVMFGVCRGVTRIENGVEDKTQSQNPVAVLVNVSNLLNLGSGLLRGRYQ